MSKTWHGVSGKLLAQPGQGEALRDILLQAAQGMEGMAGCLCYIVSTPQGQPDTVHVYEVWTDQAAHQASLALPQFQALIQRARPLLAGMDNDPDLLVHGGKTSPLA